MLRQYPILHHFILHRVLQKDAQITVVELIQCAFAISALVELLLRQGIRRPFTPQTVQPKLVLQTVMDLMQSAFVISDTVVL